MTIKEKIRYYLDYKEVSQRKFSEQTNLSDGVIKGNGSIGADKLKIIRNKFPDLNMDWLLFDEGNMIVSGKNEVVNEPNALYGVPQKEHYEAIIKLKDETIYILKQQLGIKEASSKAS